MKIKELIEKLKDCPEEWNVAISSDDHIHEIGEIRKVVSDGAAIIFPSSRGFY